MGNPDETFGSWSYLVLYPGAEQKWSLNTYPWDLNISISAHVFENNMLGRLCIRGLIYCGLFGTLGRGEFLPQKFIQPRAE